MNDWLECVEKSAFTHIAYLDDAGYPVVKALLKPRLRENERVYWLGTNTHSEKVRLLAADPRASLYFRNGFDGVCLTGTVELLQTPEARRRIWQEGDELYYPEGVDDPDYTVLRFTAQRGRFYHKFINTDFVLANDDPCLAQGDDLASSGRPAKAASREQSPDGAVPPDRP